ncbi:MAG: hypothetical protein OXN97_08895 [Bryobacterales bacterium]|nr:hypothetical protein [Bryobacterales bacterium]
MTQPVPAAPGTATYHFDHDSLEAVRPRVAGLDVHRTQIAATARLGGPAVHRPLRATPN